MNREVVAMPLIINKSEVIIKLEQDLEIYDKIFVLDNEAEFASSFIGWLKEYHCTKQIKIYLTGEAGDVGELPHYMMTQDEMNSILEFHRMYEFSDRICVFARNESYGNILNYVATGILSEEEVFEALLA